MHRHSKLSDGNYPDIFLLKYPGCSPDFDLTMCPGKAFAVHSQQASEYSEGSERKASGSGCYSEPLALLFLSVPELPPLLHPFAVLSDY